MKATYIQWTLCHSRSNGQRESSGIMFRDQDSTTNQWSVFCQNVQCQSCKTEKCTFLFCKVLAACNSIPQKLILPLSNLFFVSTFHLSHSFLFVWVIFYVYACRWAHWLRLIFQPRIGILGGRQILQWGWERRCERVGHRVASVEQSRSYGVRGQACRRISELRERNQPLSHCGCECIHQIPTISQGDNRQQSFKENSS